MDKKVKLSLSIKSALVVVITQIIIYLLNLIQIESTISLTEYRITISYIIVLVPTIFVAIFFKIKPRYYLLIPFIWIVFMFLFFVPGYYLSIYVQGYKGSVALVALGSDIKKMVAIFQISLLEILISVIIMWCKKLILHLQNKSAEQVEEKQE